MRQQTVGDNGMVLLPTACNARLLPAAAPSKRGLHVYGAAVTAVWEESEEGDFFFRRSSHPLKLPGWEGKANTAFRDFPCLHTPQLLCWPLSQTMASRPSGSRIHCYLSSQTGGHLFKGQKPSNWHRCCLHSRANKTEPIQSVRSALGPGAGCSSCSVGSQPASWFLRAADAMAAWLMQGMGQGQKRGSLASQCLFFCFGAEELVPERRPAPNICAVPPASTSCRKMFLCVMGCVGSTLTQSWGQPPPRPDGSEQ